MTKDRVLIGIAIVMASLAVAFFGVYLFSERSRVVAVEQLKVSTAVIEERYLKRTLSEPPATETVVPTSVLSEKPVRAISDEEAIRTFKQFSEKLRTVNSDEAWQDALELFRKMNWSGWTEEERQLAQAFLDANRDLLEKLHVLVDTEGPLWELNYAEGFNLKLYHLAGLRDVANMLAANIAVAMKREDYNETVRCVMTIMNLANRLSEDPILISQLVAISIGDILYQNIAQVVQGEDMPVEGFERIIGAMRDFGGTGGLEEAFAMEGLYGLKAFEGVRMGDWSPAGMSPEGADAFLMRFYGSALARPFLNFDERNYADIMNRMSAIVALPYYEANQAAEQLTEEIDSLPRTRYLSRMLLPAITRVTEVHALNEARTGLMQVGLAVEQYQGRYGVYPESLEAIVPMLNGSMPLDPYTGQPFVYEPRPNSFVLYSARGSTVSSTVRHDPRYADARGNIVWRGSRR